MYLSTNRKGRLLQLLACILLSFFYNTSLAQTVGQTRNNSGDIQIYDGTVFDEPDYGSLGACSVEGRMQFSGGTMRFCNGSTWRNLDSGVNNGTCSTAGQIRRNTTWLEFCNGTNWRKINPTHINGACLNEGGSKNLCNDGTANDGAIPDTSAQWRWRCDGLYGGSNSGTCYKNKPINGVCTNEGASNNLCAAGTANDGAVSDTSTRWRWRCDGQYGGSNSGTCYKNKPVNGVCNNATRNACSAGVSNDGAVADNATYWRWRCDGQYGGSNSGTCQKNKPVNGSCDNSSRNSCSTGVANDGAVSDTTTKYRWRCDGQYGGSNSTTCSINRPGVCGSAASGGAVGSQPTSNQCSYGTFADLSDTGSYWQWRCNGNPNSPTCQRARAAAPINGVCNNATRNACSAGSSNDGAVADTSVYWRWRCDGQNGGSNSGTCQKNKPVNGSCNNATRNACSAGVSNDGAVSDTSSYWRWRCDGQYGGSNSGTCQKNKPVNGSCGSAASGGAVGSQPTSNRCSAGSYQDLSDTGSYWQWRCNGQYGGSNSSTCQRAKAASNCTTGTLTTPKGCGSYGPAAGYYTTGNITPAACKSHCNAQAVANGVTSGCCRLRPVPKSADKVCSLIEGATMGGGATNYYAANCN